MYLYYILGSEHFANLYKISCKRWRLFKKERIRCATHRYSFYLYQSVEFSSLQVQLFFLFHIYVSKNNRCGV